MADTNDMTDWADGQPPPWLDLYGPPPGTVPPVEQIASTLGPRGTESVPGGPVAAPAPPPPPVEPTGGIGRKGGSPSRIGEGGPLAQEELANIPPAPTPVAAAAAPAPPPWLAGLQQNAQVAGGPQALAPPWLQQPQVDAVSGATAPPRDAETPDQALGRLALDPNAPVTDRQKAWQSLPPEQRAQIVSSADPNQLATIATSAMSPEELATIQVRHQQAQIHQQSAEQLRIAQQTDQDARANYQTYQAAVQQANANTAQLMADAQRLSQEKIDPKEHGVGHFIASVITGALGGAVSQYTGGRNLALEELDKQTQRRIDAQQANITNGLQVLGFKRNLVGEQLQRSGDLYHASEAYRIGTYDRAISELQTRMQDYDPQGTTNMRALGAMQQIQQQRAAAVQAYQNNQVELGLKRAQTAKALAETYKTDQETQGLKLKQAGIGAGGTKPEEIVTPDELAYIAKQTGITFPQGVTRKEVNARLGTFKGAADASKGLTEATGTLNAGLIRNPVTKQPLMDPNDPTQRLILPPTEAAAINDEVSATQNVIDSLSAVRRALASDPSTFDRKEWARIQSDVAQSLPPLAKVYGEKYSARTEDALKDLLHLDYDSYVARVKDKGTGIATIDNTIDSLIRNGNTTIGTKLGYDANQKPLFLDTSRPPESPKTPTDNAVQTLASATSDKWTDEDHAIQKMRAAGAAKATAGQIYADYGIDVFDPKFKADLERVKATNVPISKLRALDDLQAKALSGKPKDATNAVAAIAEIAKDDSPVGEQAAKVLGEVMKKLSPAVDKAEDEVFGGDGQ